jgi:hypothetical protein
MKDAVNNLYCAAGRHATLHSNLYMCTKFPKVKYSRKKLQIVNMLPAEQERAVSTLNVLQSPQGQTAVLLTAISIPPQCLGNCNQSGNFTCYRRQTAERRRPAKRSIACVKHKQKSVVSADISSLQQPQVPLVQQLCCGCPWRQQTVQYDCTKFVARARDKEIKVYHHTEQEDHERKTESHRNTVRAITTVATVYIVKGTECICMRFMLGPT